MIWHFHRKRLRVFVILIVVIFIGRWLLNLSIEYAVTNYFHHKLSPTPQTNIVYDISDIDVQWLQSKVVLQKVNVKVKYTENFRDTTIYQLFLPTFKIDLLSSSDLLINRKLNIDEVSLDYPQVRIFLPLLQDSVVLRKEVGDLQQKTLKFLQQLNLKHFEINHANVSWSMDDIPSPRYSLNDINVKMNDIEIVQKSMSKEGVTEMLLADHIEVTLHNDSLLLPDGQHTLRYKQLHLSSKDDVILIDSLHLFPLASSDQLDIHTPENNIKIPKLQLKGIDFLSLYLDNHLFIDTVLVGETDLNIKLDEQTISLFHSDTGAPKHDLDSIHIHLMQLTPSTISVNHDSQTFSNSFQADSTALTLKNVKHSAQIDSAFSWSVDNLELHLKNYQAKLEKLHYTFSFEKLNWSLLEKSFGLEGIKLYPIQDNLATQNDALIKYLEVPSFTIQDINFTDLIFHQQLSGGSIIIESPSFGINIPDKDTTTITAPINISEVLKTFFNSFHLHQVVLNNGNAILYQDELSPFVSLEHIGLIGKDWNMEDEHSSIEHFPLEAFIGQGTLNQADLQMAFVNGKYSNKKDHLSIESLQVKSNNNEKAGLSELYLQSIQLDGVRSLIDAKQLNLAEIGTASVNIHLAETETTQETPSNLPEPINIKNIKIHKLDATIHKSGREEFILGDGQANLKNVILNGNTLPLSFDLDSSIIHLGAIYAQLSEMQASIDSLVLRKRTLALYNITANTDSLSENFLSFNLPELSLSNLQLPQDNASPWRTDKVKLHQAQTLGVFFLNESDTARQNRSETKNVSESKFQLEVDTLFVDRAKWSIEQKASSTSTIWKSESSTIHAYKLNYPIDHRELYKQEINLTVSGLKHLSEKAELDVEKITLSTQNQSIKVYNSNLKAHSKLAENTSIIVDAIIPAIDLKTDNEQGWKPDQPWNFKSIYIHEPQFILSWDSLSQSQKDANNVQEKTDFPIPFIGIQNFSLLDLQLKSNGPDEHLSSIYIDGLDLNFQDFAWNTKEELNLQSLIEQDQWQGGIDHVQAIIAKPQHQLDVYGLQLNASSSQLAWDSTSFAPLAGPLEFSDYLSHQKTWMSIKTRQGLISGLDWTAATNSAFYAQSINIQNPRLHVFRDQRLPFPENHYPPFLHKAFINFQHPVSIQTIELHDGDIEVGVQPEMGEKVGSLTFSNIESVLTNVTNVTEEIQNDDVMQMAAYAQIQESGLLKANIDFDLDHPDYIFFMDVSMGKMDLSKLNSIVEPVASVKINNGQMRLMNIRAIGNEDYAYGNMDFMYRKLNLSLLSKKDHDHQGAGLAIESFLANKLILRRNNDYPFPHRQGQLFVERDVNRSIFNYWGKIAVSGILTSAGVKSNRKALHQRFEYRRKQFEKDTADTKPNALLPK